MRAAVLAVLTLAALPGCGWLADSPVNPGNWFGPREPRQVQPDEVVAPAADPRGPIARVTAARLEPVPGGAILRATGLPATQGFWDAALVAVPAEDPAVRVFAFRVAPPLTADLTRGPVREIVAATFLTDRDLAGVRRITVQGAANAVSVNR